MKRKTYKRLVQNLALIQESIDRRDEIFRYSLGDEITPEINANLEQANLLVQDSINSIEEDMNDVEHLSTYLVFDVIMDSYENKDEIQYILINDKEMEITPDNVYSILKEEKKWKQNL